MKNSTSAPFMKGGIKGGILILLLLALAAYAGQVLLETHQEGVLSIPMGQSQTLDVLTLNVSVDTACFVQINAGGNAEYANMAISLDGESLPPIVCPLDCGGFSFAIPYAAYVSAGNHTLVLNFMSFANHDHVSRCKDSYLQALIFLPDEPSAVAERPADNGLKPIAAPSIISRGPWVSAPGATELWDATGRKVSLIPQDGRIYLQNLPPGTYFAREGDTRTVLKIVKVQ